MKETTVAFIGLGRMGLPMSARLIAKGYTVLGFDLAEVAEEKFADLGGDVAASATAIGQGADMVILMLPDSRSVHRTVLGEHGVAAGMRTGAIVIDMSSSAPASTVELAKKLQRRGLRMIDAPVSGGVPRALDGTLSIMAGGDADDVEEAREVLACMGDKITHVGGIGAGHAMKALNNFVSAAGAAAAMEALIVGKRFGLDPEVMTDVLNSATGRNNTTEKKLRQFVLSGSFASGFAMELMAKDIETARELAEQLDLSTPTLQSIAELWREAERSLPAASDHTEFFTYLAARNG